MDQVVQAAKQVATIISIVVGLLGTLHVLKPEQVSPLTQYCVDAATAIGGLVVSVILIWRNLSHKEAKSDDKIQAASVISSAPVETRSAVAGHLESITK